MNRNAGRRPMKSSKHFPYAVGVGLTSISVVMKFSDSKILISGSADLRDIGNFELKFERNAIGYEPGNRARMQLEWKLKLKFSRNRIIRVNQ